MVLGRRDRRRCGGTRRLEALSGLPPGGFGATFDAWLETLHPDEVDSILAQVNDAIERRSSYHFEHRTIWPDGTVRWLECRGQVTVDADGDFTGTVGCAVDITERRDERGTAHPGVRAGASAS